MKKITQMREFCHYTIQNISTLLKRAKTAMKNIIKKTVFMKIRMNNNLLNYLITNASYYVLKEILKFNKYYKGHKSL